MRMLIAGAAFLAFASTAIAQGVYVQPHTRSDGTYVQGHYRTAPNSTNYDNWSSKPNVNPHTGKQGTKDPYPTYRSPSQPKANNYGTYKR